jgi:hypothetical protein
MRAYGSSAVVAVGIAMNNDAYTQTLRRQNTAREQLIERIDMQIRNHRQRYGGESTLGIMVCFADAEAVLSSIQADIRETTERMLNQP